MRHLMLILVPALLTASAPSAPADAAEPLPATCGPMTAPCFRLEPVIAFTSNRHNPTGNLLLTAEIYLVDPDGTNTRRLTDNDDGDGFAALSPDGKSVVFDSNRNRAVGEALNTSDLFVMHADGTEQRYLTPGSSATWSPDGHDVAYHASATGTGTPIRPDPGSATSDSDIFIANVDDVLATVSTPLNVTNTPAMIEDDPDWSPDGLALVFTSHGVGDDPVLSNSAEVYMLVLNADGTATPQALTVNAEEERGPAWSPDGTRIAYSCRIGGGSADFEICVMNADGTGAAPLTENFVPDLTPTWSPDGERIVFHRRVVGQGLQLFTINADGTQPTQLTFRPGQNLLANWGEIRVHDKLVTGTP